MSPDIRTLIDRMRAWELDTTPDGWPAVQMRDITALCDEVERLNVRANLAPTAHGEPR
jgi:hypothetical protein